MKNSRIFGFIVALVVSYMALGLLSLPLAFLIKLLYNLGFIKSYFICFKSLYLLCVIGVGIMFLSTVIKK